MKRRWAMLLATALLIAMFGASACTSTASNPEGSEASPSKQIYTHRDVIESPEEAQTLLKEGNARFVEGKPLGKDISEARLEKLSKGQTPFAVIVTCADSRVAPEVLFDQALGDVFVVRVAGNVIDPVVLGSIEYAVEHLKSPLVVVMGHSSCGAVKATVDGGEAPGSIGSIVKLVEPAVVQAKQSNATSDTLLSASISDNAELQLAAVEKSPIIEEKVKSGELKLASAVYDVATGKVNWQ